MSPPPLLPPMEVRLSPPALGPWRAGNHLPGVWSFSAEAAGPHVVVVSLVHGNEFAGAIVLLDWLRRGLRPHRGRLSLVFANLLAFERFDPADPTLSRYLDEDLNRVWSPAVLDGGRDSAELRRARELRPLLDSADLLLDLHSMLWPSDPLLLLGPAPKHRALARAVGTPALAVSDAGGHPDGLRIIDYGRFADADAPGAALLVEGGPHWQPETVPVLARCAGALLRAAGQVGEAPDPVPPPDWSLWEVTDTVVPLSRGFGFVQAFRGGTVVPRRNTVIAVDGAREIRTPYDDCLLVIPSPRVLPGHTAVRLARRASRAVGLLPPLRRGPPRGRRPLGLSRRGPRGPPDPRRP